MIQKITLLLFCLFSFSGFTQDKTYDLLKSKTQTNILYDRVFNLSKANQLDSKKITTATFNQVYHEIQRADFNQRLPKYEVLKEASLLSFATKTNELSILITDFETLKSESIQNGDVFLNHQNLYESKPNASSIFQIHSCNQPKLVRFRLALHYK